MYIDTIDSTIKISPDSNSNKYSVMSWNVHLGTGVFDRNKPENIDSLMILDGGKQKSNTQPEIDLALEQIIDIINYNDPDILILNEMTTDGCIINNNTNMLDIILKYTKMNYAVYSKDHNATILNPNTFEYWGRISWGTCIMSKYELKNAIRTQLPTRNDIPFYEQYLGFQHGLLEVELIDTNKKIKVFGIHCDAYATYDIVSKQLKVLDEHINIAINENYSIIVGGDFNIVSHKACQKKNFAAGYHVTPDLSYYTKSSADYLDKWNNIGFNFATLDNHDKCKIYNKYLIKVGADSDIFSNEDEVQNTHYTHSIRAKFPFQAKIDYIFSNLSIQKNSGKTIQKYKDSKLLCSDHAPIFAIYYKNKS
jgi:endonuclease/exonuclease/phosphatase family metal-dependent hydrolase